MLCEDKFRVRIYVVNNYIKERVIKIAKKRYMDKSVPIEERVKDLMSRMTLEEKVRQLGCIMTIANSNDPEKMDITPGIGEVAILGGGNTPQENAEYIRRIQELVIKNSPNGIPALFHCEALSGPVLSNSNLFPTSISLGATFDPQIVKEMSNITRKQMVALGIRQALAPVLDVSRDLRWGRVNETYGNDPTHVSMMACAFVEGLQGSDIVDGVAATAKHFIGYSQTEGGLNMAKTVVDERDMREVFAKPFEAAIRIAKIKSIMNSYSEVSGKPVCASCNGII